MEDVRGRFGSFQANGLWIMGAADHVFKSEASAVTPVTVERRPWPLACAEAGVLGALHQGGKVGWRAAGASGSCAAL